MKSKNNILNIETFNNYIESKNFSKSNYTGFYTHNNNIYFVGLDYSKHIQFKKKVLNRKGLIIAENTKIINQKKKKLRIYYLIDSKADLNIQLSLKALFKKFNLLYRPIYYIKINENKSRN
jgi:hypothetical protein